MGIPGLLRTLRPYTQSVHIEKYSGARIGIDAYCWLHKGAYACSLELCEKGQNVSSMQPCLNYFMHRINLLRHHNVIPVVVFDGGRLPFKAATESERQRRRDQNLELARSRASQGDVNGAVELYQRAVEITPLIAYELIKVLRAEGVEYVVAPYEADAQLAYLSTLDPENGGVSAVISEDSDLLAYGCNVVIYKMDRYGSGEEVRMGNLLGMKTYSERPPSSMWFGCFTQELFTGMCVLAGCDFLPSVGGIGIKRAHGLVSKYRDLVRVLSSLRFDRKLAVPEGYEVAFKQANAIFQHARIYDASSRKLSFLKPLSAELVKEFNGDLDFLGPDLPPSRAIAVAEGRLDPISMCAFDEIDYTDNLRVPATLQLPWKSLAAKSGKQGCIRSQVEEEVIIAPLSGTDEELFAKETKFGNTQADEEFIIASVSGTAAELFAKDTKSVSVTLHPDKGFLSHVKQLVSYSHADDCHSSSSFPTPDEQRVQDVIVTVSPGKKRVLPLHPDNNPFKKGRVMHASSSVVGGASVVTRLFNSDCEVASTKNVRVSAVDDISFRLKLSSEPGQSPVSGSRLYPRPSDEKWGLAEAAVPFENASDVAEKLFTSDETIPSTATCSESISPDVNSPLLANGGSRDSGLRLWPQNNPFRRGIIREAAVPCNDASAARLHVSDGEKFDANHISPRPIPCTEIRMHTQTPAEMQGCDVSSSEVSMNSPEITSQASTPMSYRQEGLQGSCVGGRKHSVISGKQPCPSKTQAAKKTRNSGQQRKLSNSNSSPGESASATFRSILRYYQKSDPT